MPNSSRDESSALPQRENAAVCQTDLTAAKRDYERQAEMTTDVSAAYELGRRQGDISELKLIQPAVVTIVGQELLVWSFFHDLSVVKDDNPVCLLNG